MSTEPEAREQNAKFWAGLSGEYRTQLAAALDDNDALRAERDAAVKLIESLRRSHYQSEDCWYSCPKSPEGCCNDAEGDACNCGADAANERIDAFLASLDSSTSPKGD